jgi:hypothetical protein
MMLKMLRVRDWVQAEEEEVQRTQTGAVGSPEVLREAYGHCVCAAG